MVSLLKLRQSIQFGNQIKVSLQCNTRRSLSLSKVVFNDKILQSRHKDVQTVVGATFPEFIWSNLGKWESLPAFKCAVSGRHYTHREVYTFSRGFATALLNSGLNRNDVVAILLPNVPEYAIVLLGIWEAGLIVTTTNPIYTVDEIQAQFRNCRPKCVVTLQQFLPTIEQVRSAPCSLNAVIVIGDEVPDGAHSFFEMMKTEENSSRFLKGSQINSKEEVAIIPYSSGTTGPPKGVVLTHSNLATNLLQHTCPTITVLRRYDDGNEQDRLIGILPFFHMYGLSAILSATLFMGCCSVTLPKFDPSVFVKTFKAHREGYGMTETTTVSHVLPPSSKNKKIGSIGQSIPSTLTKFVNPDTGEVLGPHEPGELYIKGPQVMKGYFENEKATKKTIDSEGWLHTGDIAYYDEDGFVYIVDRLKELIKVKGLQVAPSELEDVLRKIPGIVDCAVIGIPCSSSGELPRAYIVRNSDSLSQDGVNQFLKSKVSKHKQLAGGIEFVDEIPKAASGKILRKVLKQQYLKNHAKP